MDHNFRDGSGSIVVDQKDERLTAHQQNCKRNAEQIHRSEALVPDQREVGDRQREREDQNKRKGQDGKGLRRAEQKAYHVHQNNVVRYVFQLKEQHRIGHRDQERKQREAEIDDRVVGV